MKKLIRSSSGTTFFKSTSTEYVYVSSLFLAHFLLYVYDTLLFLMLDCLRLKADVRVSAISVPMLEATSAIAISIFDVSE